MKATRLKSALTLLAACAWLGCFAAEPQPAIKVPLGHPWLLAYLASTDSQLSAPILYEVSSNSAGTFPTPHTLGLSSPLFLNEIGVLLEPRRNNPSDFVYIYLPCEAYSQAAFDHAPSYLRNLEAFQEKKRGYYTDVYKSQYRFSQGSEPLYFVIHNTPGQCDLQAFELVTTASGSRVEAISSESVEFDRVFLCEVTTPAC